MMGITEAIFQIYEAVLIIINTLHLPFQYTFMQNAFFIVIVISLPTSILSCYLVLKGWSLIGDAISHAVLPGIIIAYLLSIPLIIGAFFSGMLCSLVTGFISDNSRVKKDTVMGVVFSGMFASGIVLYTKITSEVHLDHILFGNMLGLDNSEMFISTIISFGVFSVMVLKRKDFLLHSFDPIQSQAVGLSNAILHYSMLSMISLTIVATLSSVGIILSIGLLIAPGAIAFLLSKQFEVMLIIAVIVTLISSIAGVLLSFYIDSAPGPTIILILTAIFIISFIISGRKNNIRNMSS